MSVVVAPILQLCFTKECETGFLSRAEAPYPMKIPIFSSPTDPIEAMRVHKQRNWLAYSLLLGSFTLWPLRLWLRSLPSPAPTTPANASSAPVEPMALPPASTNSSDPFVQPPPVLLERKVVPEDTAARQALVDLAQQYLRMRSYSDITTIRYTNQKKEMFTPLGYETDETFRFARDADHTRIEDISPNRRFFGVRVRNQLQVRDTRICDRTLEPAPKVLTAFDLGQRLRLAMSGFFLVSGEGADRFPAVDHQRAATFGPNEVVAGVPCQVINLTDNSQLFQQGNIAGLKPRYRDYKIYIGIKDGLLYQMRRRIAQDNQVWGRIETHSSIKVNPKLPASTWDFVGS